jgi:spermidine synthase
MNVIEQLLTIQNRQSTLLATSGNSRQKIEIHQHGDMCWLYTGGQSIQSAMSLSQPARLMHLIPEVMLVALLLQDNPQRILNLGYGGGAFERFFATAQPDVEMVSVDGSESLVELVKAHMQVPTQWPVIVDFAEDYLQQTDQKFDLILCDLFVGEDNAECVTSGEFYQHAGECLDGNGVMAINFCPKTESGLIGLLVNARQYFNGVMISHVGDLDNVVIVLSQQPLPPVDIISAKIRAASWKWQLDFAELFAEFKLFPV